MSHDSRFDILFEPVVIGSVTTPNRFYQVPHCTGMGYRRPQSVAEMRGVKAEGGWGVVCTEYCSIHPSSDDDPYPSHAIWDEEDVRAHALMVDKVHAHGSLAGIELWHGGQATANFYTRETPRGAFSRPIDDNSPIQCREMDKRDIGEFRRWHVEAARRAQRAGFDIVYVYACHGYLLSQFLSPSNRRTDEYGGSLQNRIRLLREVIEDTKQAVGDSCAIAVRISASRGGPDDDQDTEEPRATIEMLAELPDLWDVTVADYSFEMGSSRFVKEAGLEAAISWVKGVTSKPVVSVVRFTSPETMVRLVRQGVIDLIGAARPSIADPFLPTKIREGRLEDIRACIGCNVCYNGDQTGVPLRCTQNPTMGEEWRKGWHPERIPAKGSDRSILVVGAGPAGLEAAMALGKRGYRVTLVEASTELGGRVARESKLPGLSEWGRVRDWRTTQLAKLSNVEICLDTRFDAEQIKGLEADCVALATGALWRRDGVGRWHRKAIPGSDRANVMTPEDVMAGVEPVGPVIVFDDDRYYMGGVIAEKLRRDGHEVTLVTPDGEVSSWAHKTVEQGRIQKRLIELEVRLETSTALVAILDDHVQLACTHSGQVRDLEAGSVVMVTSRIPSDALYFQLVEHGDGGHHMEIARIGDCDTPGTITTSVYAGHRYAREMDAPPTDIPFRREHARVP